MSVTWAIVPAAGSGERLDADDPKAFVPLAGFPMVARVLPPLAACKLDGLVISAPPGKETLARAVTSRYARLVPIEVVAGGATRQESVRLALDAIPAICESIVVHDAARPLVTEALVRRALGALAVADAAVCAIPVVDTLKRAGADGVVSETVARDGLWRAQTPQAFRAGALRAAHERAAAEGYEATDDAALIEWNGGRVVVVEGDERNLKVTSAEDLALAESMLTGEGMRSGPGIPGGGIPQ